MAKKPTRAKSSGETPAPSEPEELPERWSAQRKMKLVLRLGGYSQHAVVQDRRTADCYMEKEEGVWNHTGGG